MSSSDDRPEPRPSPEATPLIEAWRKDGALLLQRCGACRKAVFYPRALCPHCHATQLEWFRACGEGEVVSFSRVHRGLAPAFQPEAPIVLAEIALAEEVAMIARIVTDAPEAVRSGMAVRLVPRDRASHFALPTFEPA